MRRFGLATFASALLAQPTFADHGAGAVASFDGCVWDVVSTHAAYAEGDPPLTHREVNRERATIGFAACSAIVHAYCGVGSADIQEECYAEALNVLEQGFNTSAPELLLDDV